MYRPMGPTVYGSPINSMHPVQGTPKMSTKPARFNPWVDFHNSKKPAPTTYAPRTSTTTKKPRAVVKQQAVRMKANRYHTDAPGPGAYRV